MYVCVCVFEIGGLIVGGREISTPALALTEVWVSEPKRMGYPPGIRFPPDTLFNSQIIPMKDEQKTHTHTQIVRHKKLYGLNL